MLIAPSTTLFVAETATRPPPAEYSVPSAIVTSPLRASTRMVPAPVVVRSPLAPCATLAPSSWRSPVPEDTASLMVRPAAALSSTSPDPSAVTAWEMVRPPAVVARLMLPSPPPVVMPPPVSMAPPPTMTMSPALPVEMPLSVTPSVSVM